MQKVKAKSVVWKFFFDITSPDGSSINHAQCKMCLTILQTDNGTLGLTRHPCKWTNSNKMIPISQFTKKKTNEASVQDKKLITRALVYFCTKDLRPFEAVNGVGFRNLIDAAVKIGAKCGEVPVGDILCDPTTISRNLAEIAQSLQDELKLEIAEIFTHFGGGITTDFWMDDYTKISYFALTAHYVTSNWQLKNALLGLYDRNPEDRHIGDKIKPILYQKLKEYGITDSILKKICIFITDQGSNLVKALKYDTRLSFCAHILNNVMKNILEDKKEDNKFILQSLNSCKELVQYFAQSGLKNRLNKALNQDSDTRWYTKVDMLSSILNAWEEIDQLLIKRSETNRLDNIDKDFVQNLLDVIKPFKKAILTLECNSQSTLHSVWLHFLHLKMSLEKYVPGEDRQIRRIKRELLDVLDDKYHLVEEHKTLLHPSYKALTFNDYSVPIMEKMAIHDHVRSLLAATFVDKDTMITPASSSNDIASMNGNRNKKRRSIDNNFLDKFASSGQASSNDEFGKYLEEDVGRIPVESLLRWWKVKSSIYPKSAILPRKYLSIPATSTASESIFSGAGRTITDLRSCLKLDTVRNIMMVHYNG